jgi:hypothetical protein
MLGLLFNAIFFVKHVGADTIQPAEPHKKDQQEYGSVEVVERKAQEFEICKNRLVMYKV